MEAVATQNGLRVIDRKPAAYAPRRAELTPAQLRWCAANLKGFAWPKAERLKEKV